MIQGVGAACILIATTLLGVSFLAREKYRLGELNELGRAILFMKNRINYLAVPLSEVLEEVGWKTEGISGAVFQEVACRMKGKMGSSGEEIWREVWLAFGKESYFTAMDLEEIISFGNTLGFLEKGQQEGSMDLLLFYIREKQELIKKRLQKNGRLYYSMGVLSGLLLIVTLL